MNDENTGSEAAVPAEPARKGSPKARAMNRAAARHAVPFLLWIGAMLVGRAMHLSPSSATPETPSLDVVSDAGLYAIRTALCFAALCALRPWAYCRGSFRASHLLPAVAVGLGVFAIWALPLSDWFASVCPRGAELYSTWLLGSPGKAADFASGAEKAAQWYSPAATGWPMFAVHLFGSAVAIAAAEEFFWRAYLLRAARTPDFLDLPVGQFHAVSFLAVTAAFAAEHGEMWAAGFVAGAAYGALYLKTRDVWAAIAAHVTTNLALGLYVVATGHWEFW
ncbi:MAG: CAAX prenyl protease-related protein [Kiritimatiellae bacterium]|nr:CAAX prenyl protease-related protein [Kiritimatiellia bacterium]